MENNNSFENIEEFIRSLDISLAELERTGSAFISIGYAFFIYATYVDVEDLINENSTDSASASITLQGQELIFLGYIILWVVAERRIYARNLRNDNTDEDVNISPYIKLARAYLLSTYANALRLEAFTEIANSEDDGPVIV